MPSYDGSLNFDTKIDEKGFNKGTKSMSKSVKKFGTKTTDTFKKVDKSTVSLSRSIRRLGKVLIAAFSIKVLVGFGKQALQLASDLQEVQNIVDVVFKDMAKNIDEFAKTTLERFGLSTLSTKQYISALGAMGSSMGFAAEQNLEMSKTLTGLIGDFASFYNISQDRANLALSAVYTGETETLKRYGILITEINLQEFARQQGIEKSITKMTQQEKVMLRYNYILQATENAQGDFLRTQDSWANQLRILTERWKEFLALIGTNLIAVFTPVLQMLNKLVALLISATNQFNAFHAAISGKQVETQSEVTSGISDSVDEQKNLTDAVEETNKALKGSVAGFDELNILQKKSAGGVDAGITIDPFTIGEIDSVKVTEASEAVGDFSPILNKFLNLIKLIQDINLDKLNESINNLSVAIQPLTEAFFSGLEWFYVNALVPLATFTIEDVLPRFLDLLAVAIGVLNPLLEAFKPLMIFLWENLFSPMADFVGDAIILFLDLLILGLEGFSDWMLEYNDLIVAWTGTILAFFAAWQVVKVMAFIQISGGLANAFKIVTAAIFANTGALIKNIASIVVAKVETLALTALYAKDFVLGIGKATAAMIENGIQYLIVAQIYAVQMVKSIATMILSVQLSIWNWGVNTAAMIANKIAAIALTLQNVLLTAGIWLYNTAITAGTIATTAFTAVLAILTSPITLVIGGIIALVTAIVLLVKNWDTVKEASEKAWEGMKKVWITVGDWFKVNVIEPIANAFIALINGINSGMNFMIRGLNKIKIDIPDWVPGSLGGKSFGFDIAELGKIEKLSFDIGRDVPPSVRANPQSNVGYQYADSQNASSAQPQPPIIIKFEGELAELARMLNPTLSDESKRKGQTMEVQTE